jgi:hypothetical protein
MRTITIARKALYDQVWSQPMLHLAKRYGISNVGLAKICRKHDIPRPPRGHWARLQFGKASPQTPLPRPDEDYEITMQEPPPLRQPAEKVGLPKPVEPITVGETLRNAHELVSQAKHQLQNAPTDENRLIVVPADAVLDISVSKGRLHRALLITDALLGAAEKLGYRVAKGPRIEVAGFAIRFDIKERLETLRDDLPEEPDLEADHYDFGHSRFKKTTNPSGHLVLSIVDDTPYWRYKGKRAWRDGSRSLEDSLNSILRGIVGLAEYKAECQAEKQRQEEQGREQERQRQEAARRQQEQRERVDAEHRRVNALLRQAKNWRKSEILRGYIEANRQKHLAACGQAQPSGAFAEWLQWATQQADRLDPLTESPPILDEDTGDE